MMSGGYGGGGGHPMQPHYPPAGYGRGGGGVPPQHQQQQQNGGYYNPMPGRPAGPGYGGGGYPPHMNGPRPHVTGAATMQRPEEEVMRLPAAVAVADMEGRLPMVAVEAVTMPR